MVKIFKSLMFFALVSASAYGAERIVFVGDSITGQSRNSADGYANVIDAAFAATIADESERPVVVSLGGSGQGVGSWINVETASRENKQTTLDVAGVHVGENLDQHADRLVVMLGMNDVLSPYVPFTAEGCATWRERLDTLVAALVARATPDSVYIASSPPCTEVPEGPRNDFLRALALEAQSYCAANGYTFIPVHDEMCSLIREGRRMSADFRVTGDCVHPNSYGHALIAKLFLSAFGKSEAASWVESNRRQPQFDAVRTGNRTGLAWTLTYAGAGATDGLFRFSLSANWVVRPGETAPSSTSVAIILPEGWTKVSESASDGVVTFAFDGPADMLATSISLSATGDGETRSAEIGVPAPWLVTAPHAMNVWKANDWSVLDEEAIVRSFSSPPESGWNPYFAAFGTVGGNDPDSIDFCAFCNAAALQGGWAKRYVYVPRKTSATITVSGSKFSGIGAVTVWLNGEQLIHGIDPKGDDASAHVWLEKGSNELLVRSSHVTWQWQNRVSMDISGSGDSVRYGISPIIREDEEEDSGYRPETSSLPDGSIIYRFRESGTFKPLAAGRIQAFLVGGGGGGAGNPGDVELSSTENQTTGPFGVRAGGGGGGGGTVFIDSIEVAKSGYPIIIGAGGAQNENGGDTVAFGRTAFGGGRGGCNNSAPGVGASGGGAGSLNGTGKSFEGAEALSHDGEPAQGHRGGRSYTQDYNAWGWAGGGGGAGGPGGDACTVETDGNGTVTVTSHITSGQTNGGPGVACPFMTDGVLYGQGGRGGTAGSQRPAAYNCGNAGTDGLGMGGDGCNSYVHINAGYGGKGGSGTVLIRFFPREGFYADKARAVQSGGEISRVGRHEYIHVFREDGILTISQPIKARALVVGGGGAGGSARNTTGGGGGAGGVLVLDEVLLPSGEYLVTVGTGAKSACGNGNPSYFAGYTALGGGGGCNGWDTVGNDGASGGGGGAWNNDGAAGGAAIQLADGTYQGNAGGSGGRRGGTGQRVAGGGGGAGGPGLSGSANNRSGDGGPGVFCDITGESVCYGAGGGAGGYGAYPGLGGSDGVGGKGGMHGTDRGSDGAPNTGSGGGGEGSAANINGGAGYGADGIVVIRYEVAPPGLKLVVR